VNADARTDPAGQAPPRSAHIALVTACSLCAQAPSRQAHADTVTATPVDEAERANRWVVLALSGSAALMTTLDSSIVNIALPSIAHAFAAPLTGTIEWVLIGYLVTVAASLLTFGRVADMVGRRPVFLGGLALFMVSSALCGAAPSLPLLIAARCLQGLGAAAIFATNVALITRAFPASERGQALGTNAVLVAVGISAGPTLGGILTTALDWRAIFYVNVPIGAVVLFVGWRALSQRQAVVPQRFDVRGAILLGLGLAALTAALSFGSEWGWVSVQVVTTTFIAIVALVAAVFVERRQPAPIIDFGLFRNRLFALANLSFALCMVALFAVGFLLPFYFEELRGFDTLTSGLLLTPLALSLAFVAPLSGILADRGGSRWLSPIGLGIACIGLVLLSRIGATTPILYLVASLIVVGVGQGLFQAPNTRAIMGAAPPSEQGAASGTLATARVLGQSLSVALAGAVFVGLGGAAAGTSLMVDRGTLSANRVTVLEQNFVTAIGVAFLLCAAVAAIGVVTSIARGSESRER
jgi:EmrB/QacA subfamily drug resistance transporter